MSFLLTLAWRESRRARRRLLLFVASMALGIGALVALRSFSANVQASVEAQAHDLFGADLSVAARQPFTDAQRARLDTLATAHTGQQATEVAFTSMALFPRTGGTRLVEVRALDGPFPFYGTLATTPADAAAAYQRRGDALVDASLLLQYGAQVGDTVRIGTRGYRIGGRIDGISGQAAIGALVGPRVYLPYAALDTTLLGRGSRMTETRYFRFDDADPDAVAASVRETFRDLDLRVETARGAQDDWGEALGYLARFLQLVGFVALLLGGLGVASAITVYLRQKQESVATLRCLGLTAREVLIVYALQALTLGAAGATLGVGFGLGVQFILPTVLGDFLPVDVAVRVVPRALLEGFGIGLVAALLFALAPLVAVRRIPPLRALRADATAGRRFDALQAGLVVLGLVGLVGFGTIQTESLAAGAGFAGGVALVFVLLAGLAVGVRALARRLLPPAAPFVLRQGLANLYRPGNQTLVLLLTLGLGAFLLLTLLLTQRSLLDRVTLAGGDRPDLILFDIQADQQTDVAALVRSQGLPILEETPIVTMRLAAIAGRSVETLRADSTRPSWVLRRDYRSTYRDALVDGEQLTAGRFVARVPADTAVVPISIEADIASDLGVGLGDRMTWDVAGIPIETEVASVRRVDWARPQLNFFVVFPAGPLDEAPRFGTLTTRAGTPERSAQVQRALVQAFPNVSVLDVGLVLDVVERVLGRVAFVLQFMALFALGTGLLVLAGAVRVSRLQRIEESILLRTLGADRRQVTRILLAEYALLGTLAVVAGALLAVAGSAALAMYVFDVPYVPAPGVLLAALVGLPSLTVLFGVAGSRGLLDRPPLDVLRDA